MKKIFLLMAILFISLYGGINYYIGSRAWQYIGQEIPFLNNKIYWIVFSLIAAAYIISILIEIYCSKSSIKYIQYCRIILDGHNVLSYFNITYNRFNENSK